MPLAHPRTRSVAASPRGAGREALDEEVAFPVTTPQPSTPPSTPPSNHPSSSARPSAELPLRFGGARHGDGLARGLLVAPSILSADFARLGEECRAALAAGGDLLHVDVMDGHFVPNLSMGPAICAAVHAAIPSACLDVHLMVTDPAAYVEPFAKAGAAHITFHIEVVDDPRPLIESIHALGLSAGLAINPDTPAEAIVPYLDAIELALVMSVHPGFSGQKFIDRVLPKTRAIRAAAPSSLRVQMDGGVSPATAGACKASGCDLIVAASAIFGQPDYAAAIAAIRSADGAG